MIFLVMIFINVNLYLHSTFTLHCDDTPPPPIPTPQTSVSIFKSGSHTCMLNLLFSSKFSLNFDYHIPYNFLLIANLNVNTLNMDRVLIFN